MKIGLLSDSHGHTKRLRAAVEALVDLGAEAIVHCGDILGADDVKVLGDPGVPAYLVCGNMDRRPRRLAGAASECGVAFSRRFVAVPLGNGRYLAALHGDDTTLLDELVAGGQFPYVCRGHTHRAADERHGNVRVICPGALRHPKHPGRPSAAVLDTAEDALTFIKVR